MRASFKENWIKIDFGIQIEYSIIFSFCIILFFSSAYQKVQSQNIFFFILVMFYAIKLFISVVVFSWRFRSWIFRKYTARSNSIYTFFIFTQTFTIFVLKLVEQRFLSWTCQLGVWSLFVSRRWVAYKKQKYDILCEILSFVVGK